MAEPVWLTGAEHRTVTALFDLLVPADGVSPGAGECGGADYVDQLLGAFTFDPPRIWAGGPFSGRHGGSPTSIGGSPSARSRSWPGASASKGHRV